MHSAKKNSIIQVFRYGHLHDKTNHFIWKLWLVLDWVRQITSRKRNYFSSVPRRVEYSSSYVGKEVQPLIEAMVKFAGKYEVGMSKEM